MIVFIFFVWLCITAYCGAILIRNDRVYRFRMELLNKVGAAADRDIQARRDWMWRYEAFRKVSYREMMYPVWKPLKAESFYDDVQFLYSNINLSV